MTSLPKTMNAMVLVGHGGLDKLEYHTNWPVPQIGSNDVLIRVTACGLNNTDINTRTAWYSNTVSEGITEKGGKSGFATADTKTGSWSNTTVKFPLIQGADIVGNIVAVGDMVNAERIGERVIVDPWMLGRGDWTTPENSGYLGSECDGGFADYAAIRAENVHAIDSGFTDAELATFPTVLTTAEHLIWRTHLQPGETVVISGASGGVGTTAIQLCKARGAHLIGIAALAKAPELLALGCDAVIDRQSEDLEGEIRTHANGPVDVALDVVGGHMCMPLLNALRQRGRYSSSGAIAGPIVQFDLRQLIYKDLQLTGATITPPGVFARAVQLIRRGLIRPMLASAYPLAELAAAQSEFLAKAHTGKIVVTMT